MTNISTLGQALDQIERLKEQQLLFGTLSTQLTTGKKTQVFSGLGTQVLTSERARADFKSLDTYITNITNADRRLKLMLTTINEFKEQTENFADVLINFSQESVHQEGEIVYWDDPTTPDDIEQIPVGMSSAEADVDLKTLQTLAGNIFNYVTDLLNAQETDRYILGGAETLQKPLTITGTLSTAVSTILTDWKNGAITSNDLIADFTDRTATLANPNALTDSIIGYNAALSSGNAGDVFVRVSETSEINYTVTANEDPFRDILVALSYFMSEDLGPIADEVHIDTLTGLPVIDTEGAPGATTAEMKENFFEVFESMARMVNKALEDIDQQRFKIEGARAQIDKIKKTHTNDKNLLLTTIGDVENVDQNEVAVKLQQMQIQLEASYRVTALTKDLSLVNFLGF
jgi:flagellar hook-associated protein 3 FlgL